MLLAARAHLGDPEIGRLDVTMSDPDALEVAHRFEQIVAEPLELIERESPGRAQHLIEGVIAGRAEQQRGVPADVGRVEALDDRVVAQRPKNLGLHPQPLGVLLAERHLGHDPASGQRARVWHHRDAHSRRPGARRASTV